MSLLAGLLWPKIVAGVCVIAGILAFWFKAKRDGRAEARAEQEQANAEAMVKGAAERDRVRAAGPDAARRELHEHYDRPGG